MSNAIEILTHFQYLDGTCVSVWIEAKGKEIIISDNGDVISWLKDAMKVDSLPEELEMKIEHICAMSRCRFSGGRIYKKSGRYLQEIDENIQMLALAMTRIVDILGAAYE